MRQIGDQQCPGHTNGMLQGCTWSFGEPKEASVLASRERGQSGQLSPSLQGLKLMEVRSNFILTVIGSHGNMYILSK